MKLLSATVVVILSATAAYGQGSGLYIGNSSATCAAITSKTTDTWCADSVTSTWQRWNGSAFATVGGTSDGALGRVQLSNGSGLFTSDSLLLFDTTNKHLTSSGLALNLVTKSGNYTATRADHVILVDATSGPVTITLPAATTQKGLLFVVKKIDASANAVTVQRTGSDTIDGDTTAVVTSRWASANYVSDGVSAWAIY